MKNNIVCIDLDLMTKDQSIRFVNKFNFAKVESPCTLSDASEKFGRIKIGFKNNFDLLTEKDVEHFKQNHLYKPEYEEGAFYVCDGEIYKFIDGLFRNGEGYSYEVVDFKKIHKA